MNLDRGAGDTFKWLKGWVWLERTQKKPEEIGKNLRTLRKTFVQKDSGLLVRYPHTGHPAASFFRDRAAPVRFR